MADPVLDLGRKLGDGYALLRQKKDRIISESALPCRLFRDPPLPAAFKGFIASVGSAQDKDAPEGRPSARRRGHPSGHPGASGCSCSSSASFAGIPGGIDARRPVQCVDLQPRIVGKSRLAGQLRNRPRLLEGIFQKGCRRLRRSRGDPDNPRVTGESTPLSASIARIS